MLTWQLMMDGRPIAGGTELHVFEVEVGPTAVNLTISDTASGQVRTTIAIFAAATVSGKYYLLAYDGAQNTLVLRYLQKNTLIAMDTDRFSSLQNELQLSMVEKMLITGSQMSALFSNTQDAK